MAKLYPFSEQVRQLLESMPEPGETHLWLARVAGGISRLLTREQCFDFLRSVCDEGVRHREVPDREIEGALNLAYEEQSETANSGRGRIAWPIKDGGLMQEVLAMTAPAFDVEKDTGLGPRDVLPGLFRPGELVCAGVTSDKPRIRAVEEWMGDAERMQFVCVNPMKATFGKNKDGGVSVRCQDNVKLRRYVVAEFDDPEQTKGMQAQLLTALSRLAPLVLVVDSGGKSLHGWFRVEELGAKDQVRFFSACCALGADRTRWDICGWLRMPGGLRPGGQKSEVGGQDSGIRQRIVYARLRLADKGYGISAPHAGLDKGNSGGGL